MENVRRGWLAFIQRALWEVGYRFATTFLSTSRFQRGTRTSCSISATSICPLYRIRVTCTHGRACARCLTIIRPFLLEQYVHPSGFFNTSFVLFNLHHYSMMWNKQLCNLKFTYWFLIFSFTCAKFKVKFLCLFSQGEGMMNFEFSTILKHID